MTSLRRPAFAILALLSSVVGGFRPTVEAATPVIRETGETSLNLDVGFGIRFVPASRVSVPVGEILRVTAPNLGPVQWIKDGKAIPGATNATLAINGVQPTDSGSYQALYTDPAMAGRGSQGLLLSVGPVNRFLNLSARVTLAAGAGENSLSGFVVAGSAPGKKLIVRAIGPSLAGFGVANPLRSPVLRLYESGGKRYENGYVYPAVVGGPTYESDLADSLARCGAFPIPAGTEDVVLMMPFLPGNYVAEVTSRDQTGGMVLLEIYEVP